MRLDLATAGLVAALVGLTAGCGGQVENAAAGGRSAGADAGAGGTGGDAPCLGCVGGTGGYAEPPCNLAVVAAGELPPQGQRKVDSVSIAASAKSFVIAYVEKDPANAGIRNFAVVRLDDSGQLGSVMRDDLPACTHVPQSNGSAVTFDPAGSAGLAAFAVTDCGKGAGVVFIPLSADGGLGTPNIALNPTFSALTFGSHALAGVGANRFAFVYLAPGPPPSAQLAFLSGDQFDGNAFDLFGAAAADSVAVTTSSSVRGILGHLDSGEDALQMGPPTGNAQNEPPYAFATKPWSTVAAIKDRVAVAFPAAVGMEYRLFLVGQPIHSGTLAFGASLVSGDIVALRDRLVAVGASATGLYYFHIEDATGTPSTGQEFASGSGGAVGGQTLTNISSVAIAAARNSVAVVYRQTGAPSGWVLLSCHG